MTPTSDRGPSRNRCAHPNNAPKQTRGRVGGWNAAPDRDRKGVHRGNQGTHQQRDRPRTVLRGAVHGCARYRDRECRPAIDPERSRHRADHLAMGRHRVRPRARRFPTPRRQDGRPLGAPPHAADGIDPVLVRLAARGGVAIRRAPDRRPGPSGLRGSAHRTRGAVDPRRDVRGGRRAQSRARDLRRHRRDLGVGRGDRQRAPHRRPRLALGLLHQRSDTSPGRSP
jgi:hypothetical protein